MRNERIEAHYKQMLSGAKDAKSLLMEDVSDGLPYEEVSAELDSLNNISGAVMTLAVNRGVPALEVPGRPGFVSIELGGTKFTSHASKMGCTVVPAPVQNNVVPAADCKPVRKEMPAEEEKESEAKEEISKSFVELDTKQEENSEVFDRMEMKKTEDDTKTELLTEEVPENAAPNEELSIKEDIPENEDPYDIDSMDSYYEEETGEEKGNAPFVENTDPPVVSTMTKGDLFIEEKSKELSEMVFDTYKIGIAHRTSVKPEDMFFMIAPLEIVSGDASNVPVIVYAYYKGQYYVASSYDNKTDGRNIVTMSIGDYEVLARGSFRNGQFESMLVTTGISANQGDTLQIYHKDMHHPVGRQVRNGHIKFRYQSDDGPGVIEVFALEPEGRDFLIMNRYGENDDWIDYICINDRGGLSRALIYDGGMKCQVICNWVGEMLEADIVPV